MGARLGIVLGLLLALHPAPSVGEQALAIDEARAFATRLIATGNAAAAQDIAKALLRRDPEDHAAHLLLARAARALGDTETARTAARAAWRTARSDNERYNAALVRAQVLSSSGGRPIAQFWLRRAAQIAPTDSQRARAIRDFRYVQKRTPVTTRLKFGARPSSNINNGARSETMFIGGLPFRLSGDAQALSGIEFTYGIDTQYNRVLDQRRRLRLGFSVDGRAYSLSPEAREQAPGRTGSDYAYASTELRFGMSFADSDRPAVSHLDFALGQNWYAGDELALVTRATFSRNMRISQSSRLRFSLEVEDQHRKDEAVRSSTSVTTWASWSHRLTSGGVLRLGLGWRETVSDLDTVDHGAALGSITYSLGKPVMGTIAIFSVDFEARDYEGGLFGMVREDRRLSAGVNLLFSDINYYGFAPRLGVVFERTHSTIGIYDTQGVEVSFGVQSVF